MIKALIKLAIEHADNEVERATLAKARVEHVVMTFNGATPREFFLAFELTV